MLLIRNIQKIIILIFFLYINRAASEFNTLHSFTELLDVKDVYYDPNLKTIFVLEYGVGLGTIVISDINNPVLGEEFFGPPRCNSIIPSSDEDILYLECGIDGINALRKSDLNTIILQENINIGSPSFLEIYSSNLIVVSYDIALFNVSSPTSLISLANFSLQRGVIKVEGIFHNGNIILFIFDNSGLHIYRIVLLENPISIEIINEYISPDIIDISLNYEKSKLYLVERNDLGSLVYLEVFNIENLGDLTKTIIFEDNQILSVYQNPQNDYYENIGFILNSESFNAINLESSTIVSSLPVETKVRFTYSFNEYVLIYINDIGLKILTLPLSESLLGRFWLLFRIVSAIFGISVAAVFTVYRFKRKGRKSENNEITITKTEGKNTKSSTPIILNRRNSLNSIYDDTFEKELFSDNNKSKKRKDKINRDSIRSGMSLASGVTINSGR